MLRYLFAGLINEEVKRDEAYRATLLATGPRPNGLHRDNAPLSLSLPATQLNGWKQNQDDNESAITPRPPNGYHYPLVTPGLTIGVATPGAAASSHGPLLQNTLPSTAEEGDALEKGKSHASNPRTSGDYFSSNPPLPPSSNGRSTEASNASEPASDVIPQSPSDPEKDAKSSSLFGKKFRMTFPKKLGRSSAETKPAVVDDKSETSEKSSEKEDKIVEDNFSGIVQKIRNDYDEQLAHNPVNSLQSGINPSLPTETPVLKPPLFTTVIIQEDRPDSGGVADLYRGTVNCVGQDADLIEKAAPMWLGDLLLRVRPPFNNVNTLCSHIPEPDTVQGYREGLVYIRAVRVLTTKHRRRRWVSPDTSFMRIRILRNYSNSRLNANRMLRAKKILAYVAERIEPMPEKLDPDALKPEEYLDLYCHDFVGYAASHPTFHR